MALSASRTDFRSVIALLLSGALLLGGCAGQPAGQDPAAGAPGPTSESSDVVVTPDGAGQLGPAPAAPSASGSPTGQDGSAQPGAPDPAAPAGSTRDPGRQVSTGPATAVSSARKGVGVWNFTGVSEALASSNAGWYYTWSTQHPGIKTPPGVTFVPMIWGPGSVTPTELARAKAAGPYLLGFNEPDLAEQSNMDVEQALDLWPQLEATGAVLGSPAVAWGGADAGGWLDRFMSGARQRGLRVDFIALHWYGGDFTTANAVNQLRQYIEAVHRRYGKPIWLTEFALIRFAAGGAQFPSEQQQAAFLSAATEMLAGLPYLQRYAWFGLPATDRDRTGLFSSGSQPTAIGRAFQSAR